MVNVIINADDFGKSPARNRAIDDSFKMGLIRSAGLIVTGKYLPEAVDYINEGGYVNNIHLHMNLSSNLLQENSEDTPISESMKTDPSFCSLGKFKQYRGLPRNISTVRKWKLVYCELVAQYKRFIEVTEGNGNNEHIDFHLWYNLTWPVSLALNRFLRKYRIKSFRFCGIHQKNNLLFKFYRILTWTPGVQFIPATNIDYYLSKRNTLKGFRIIELYCHPNYKEGIFLDDSPSYLKHERQPMQKQIQELRQLSDIRFVSWEDTRGPSEFSR